MGWYTVPCRGAGNGIAEATFTELRYCPSFDVVGCFRRSQVSVCDRWLANVDQMHQQAEFELDCACDWQPVDRVVLVQVSRGGATKPAGDGESDGQA